MKSVLLNLPQIELTADTVQVNADKRLIDNEKMNQPHSLVKRTPPTGEIPMNNTHLEVLRNLHNALLVGHNPQFSITDLDKVLNPVRKSIIALLEVCDESAREWFTENYYRELNKGKLL